MNLRRWMSGLILAVGAGLVGPALAGGQPAWILNPPQKAGYIYGVGSAEIYAGDAEARVRAKDQATMDLMQQIEVNVSASQETRNARTRINGQDSAIIRQIDQRVSSQVPEFKFTELGVADTYKDRKDKVIYVLAELNIAKEKLSLQSQIDTLDGEIAGRLQRFEEEAPQGLDAIRRYLPALVTVERRAQIQERLNRLSPEMTEAAMSGDARALREGVMEKLRGLRVMLSPEAGADERLKRILREQLTAKGLRLVSSGPADVSISYRATVRTQEYDGLTFGIADGDVTLKDAGGRTVSSFRARTKGTSADPGLAEERAMDKLGDKLGDELVSAFFE